MTNNFCRQCRHLLVAHDAVNREEITQCGYDGGEPLREDESIELCPAISEVIKKELRYGYSSPSTYCRIGSPSNYYNRV